MLLATIPSGIYYFGDVLEIIDNQYIDFVEEYKNNIFNEIKIEDKKYYLTLIPIISDIITYYTTNEEDATLEYGNNKEKTINIKNNYFSIIDENLIDKSKLNDNYILQQKIEFETMFSIYYYNNESLQNYLKLISEKIEQKNTYLILKFNKNENIELYDFNLISTLPSGTYIIGYIIDLLYREYEGFIQRYDTYEINNYTLDNIIDYYKKYIEKIKIKLIEIEENKNSIIKKHIHTTIRPNIIFEYTNFINTYELLNTQKSKIYYSYSRENNDKLLINSLNNFIYNPFHDDDLFGLLNVNMVKDNYLNYGTIYEFTNPIFFGEIFNNNGTNSFIIKSKNFYLEIKSNNDIDNSNITDNDDSKNTDNDNNTDNTDNNDSNTDSDNNDNDDNNNDYISNNK